MAMCVFESYVSGGCTLPAKRLQLLSHVSQNAYYAERCVRAYMASHRTQGSAWRQIGVILLHQARLRTRSLSLLLPDAMTQLRLPP
eukprot:6174023-Pleurochrysis_carterae.AAC.6